LNLDLTHPHPILHEEWGNKSRLEVPHCRRAIVSEYKNKKRKGTFFTEYGTGDAVK